MDVGLSCLAANLSSGLSGQLKSSQAWATLSPLLEDGIAALVRPVVQSCLKGGAKAEDFGYEWLKQFLLLQTLRLLSNAGVPGTALSASFSKVFDSIASGNPDLLQLVVDLVPIILEVLMKAAVSSTPHGWVLAYVVVPLLLELFKSQQVQAVLGQISAAVVDSARRLKDWIAYAWERLREFLAEVGVVVGVVGVVAAGAASAAGPEALGTLAVSLGLVSSPAAPAAALLGIASVSGVIVGVVAKKGYDEAQRLLLAALEDQGGWSRMLVIGSEVELFVQKPRRRWVSGRVCIAFQQSVSITYSCGGEEGARLGERFKTPIQFEGKPEASCAKSGLNLFQALPGVADAKAP